MLITWFIIGIFLYIYIFYFRLRTLLDVFYETVIDCLSLTKLVTIDMNDNSFPKNLLILNGCQYIEMSTYTIVNSDNP